MSADPTKSSAAAPAPAPSATVTTSNGADAHRDKVSEAKAAVMKPTLSVPVERPVVKGYDFNKGLDRDALLRSMLFTGYQATHFGRAVDIVNNMLKWRLSDEPKSKDELDSEANGIFLDRANIQVTRFLGYTSNLISSGLREHIRFLCQHKLVDCVVTTAGGIEEDFIKCLKPTFVGEFSARGSELRSEGLNRIGNLVVPNSNYVAFEDWLTPILKKMLAEQQASGAPWTPSRMIARLGAEINNEESVYYWCARNGIPVFCPAITDGSLGDMMFFFNINHPGLTIDILADLSAINLLAMGAHRTGALILGGGLVKHHICNANLMRNGIDHAVYVNTAHEFDGSDAGASPDEAVSWGKIKANAESVKVCADATLVFPLLVAQTFAEHVAAQGKIPSAADIAAAKLAAASGAGAGAAAFAGVAAAGSAAAAAAPAADAAAPAPAPAPSPP